MIIIGGPGQSGTTYMATALGRHPLIANFEGVELKILSERDGLKDLGRVLCDSFTPNRGWVALARFRQLVNQLSNGGFDQPLLAGPGIYVGGEQALSRFFDAIAPGGVARPLAWPCYRRAAKGFFGDIAAPGRTRKPAATHFLEKMPHNLLSPDSIDAFVSSEAFCIHVIRDPRATAISLAAQKWGPGSLASAIPWVQSYYEQWFAIRPEYNDHHFLELRIEDLASSPTTWENRILDWLGLPYQPIFSDVRANVLGNRLASLDQEKCTALDDGLGQIAHHLGYRRSVSGEVGEGPTTVTRGAV